MAAPALVMLSHGSLNHRVTEVTHRLRVGLQSLRPELEVNAAFIDHCPPTVPQVVSQLTAREVTEIVFVPLEITTTLVHDPDLEDVMSTVQVAHPALKYAIARPVGPEARLLNVLDRRLRRALAAAHVTELDGLVLSCAGPADLRGMTLLARRARQWGAHHNLTCTVAMSHEPGDAVGPAIVSLYDQGHRHVAVGSFYLTSNRFFWAQARQALRHGAVAVSGPIEADEVVYDAVLARYSFAAMELLDLALPMPVSVGQENELAAVAW